MLYNHGWEKQQTQKPKGSGPKKGQKGKETHQKKSCQRSKRTILKAYGWTKFTCIKIAKRNNYVNLL